MKHYDLLDDQGRATPLSNFLSAHRGYRRDAARFPAAVRGLAAQGFPAERLAALRNHWRGYEKVLVEHHEMEDHFLFPMIRASEPSLAGVLDELAGQHSDLDEQIEAINGWLAELPAPEAVEPTAAAFEELEAAVSRHLDLEEQHIVPIMQANPPQPPPPAAPGGDGPPGPPDDMDYAFAGPWLADGLDDDVLTALLDAAPPPFKVDFDENRRRYTEQLHLWSS